MSEVDWDNYKHLADVVEQASKPGYDEDAALREALALSASMAEAEKISSNHHKTDEQTDCGHQLISGDHD